MASYHGLASIYDMLMEGVDYTEWANYINQLTEKYQVDVNSVLDIACGTGNTSIPLNQLGWRVTGIDLSQQMLQLARKKASEKQVDVIFLQQDIREMELTYYYDLVTCFQDGLNYLLSTEELEQTFKNVNKYLNPGGIFIFDLNLVAKYSGLSSEETSFIDTEDYSLVYETKYLHDNEIWEIQITGFVKDDIRYSKFQEIHKEKHHHLEDVKESLSSADFKVLDIFEAFSLAPPQANSRRIFIVAQKNEGVE